MNNEDKILGLLDQMQTTMTQMNGRLGNLENDVATLKEDMAFTKETAVRMELDHGDKLKALLDGHAAIKEVQDGHTARLTRMERKIENLDIRVDVHDIQLKASN